VFVDDRADERAMVQEAFPDLVTLDPGERETWRLIDLWGDMAFGSSDLDRTQLYRDQSLRDALTDSGTQPDGHADAETLKKLGLVIAIGDAKRGDLKRVVELINRSNQWNLCGTRTSFEQVLRWHESASAQVLVASVSDRFGAMGIVCATVVIEHDASVEIPVFVLSCRVFGYGVESAMLGEISRRCGIGSQHKSLRGLYRSNTQNHPCRNMYLDHGFAVAEGGVFEWSGVPALPGAPWAELRLLS
jgi:FkbH-like protein